jgi:hypothetical protein
MAATVALAARVGMLIAVIAMSLPVAHAARPRAA